MKKIIIVGVAILVIIAVVAVSNSLSPLRRSEDEIKKDLLKLTPIGMDMENVIATLKRNKEWDTLEVSDEHGVLYDQRFERPMHYASYIEGKEEQVEIGEKSVSIGLGHYGRFVNVRFVRAWWAFDENSRLINILIEKD